ncbi:MAG TPA: TMEM165/GDT1 family protein [Candidatus Acetothermia bacterium]|nr:TMEM165/GDT1 family protein [Candidatus Acetothermia bacterium]
MLQTILSTFALVFMAELGDKTQITVFTLASQSYSPWAIFIGAGSALLLSSAIAVVLGTVVGRFLPAHTIRFVHYGAGALFILIGVWTIWKA